MHRIHSDALGTHTFEITASRRDASSWSYLVNPASFETCALPLMISSVVCKSRFAELHLVTASLAAACEEPFRQSLTG